MKDRANHRLKSLGQSALWVAAAVAFFTAGGSVASGQMLRLTNVSGVMGGRLNASLRAEPKTLNPVFAMDISSRAVTSIMNADLLHINRTTDAVEPALAISWNVSRGG